MVRIRQTRRFAALLALVSLLFMQLAVAAYACPDVAAAQLAAATEAAEADMQDCHGMDSVQPNLCQAHDQAGNQSLDKPPSPDIQPFIPAALQVEVRNAETRQAHVRVHPRDIFLKRATAPPHTIDHCCFRI